MHASIFEHVAELQRCSWVEAAGADEGCETIIPFDKGRIVRIRLIVICADINDSFKNLNGTARGKDERRSWMSGPASY